MKNSKTIRSLFIITLFVSVIILQGFGGKPREDAQAPFNFVLSTELSDNFIDKLILYYPKKNQVIHKGTVLVKGVNRFATPVFVNGVRIAVKADGRFSYKLNIPKVGKHNVVVSYMTPDYKMVNLHRKVIRLFKAPTNKVNNRLRQTDMYFFNTSFFPTSKVPQLLRGYVTRAELAYFLSRLNPNYRPVRLKSRVFLDVSRKHWAASSIKFVTYHRYMSTYPNVHFKPNNSVQKIDYVVALNRLFNLDLKAPGDVPPFRDLNPAHWTYDFIRAAYNKGLLPQREKFKKDRLMDQFSLYHNAKRLPKVRQAIAHAKSFETGFVLSLKNRKKIIESLEKFIFEKRQLDYRNRKIKFDTPRDEDVILAKTVTFKGNVFPSQLFRLDGDQIVPTLEGHFSVIKQLRFGRNEFDIEVFDKKMVKIPSFNFVMW